VSSKLILKKVVEIRLSKRNPNPIFHLGKKQRKKEGDQ